MNINLDVSLLIRRDTEENWTTKNPILLDGELGYVTFGGDAGMSKMGDGVTPWNDLDYTRSVANGGVSDFTRCINTYEAVLLASSWAGEQAPYTQTVSVRGLQSYDCAIVDMIIREQDDISKQKTSWSYVDDIEINRGSITVTCYQDKPDIDLDIQILAFTFYVI